MLSNRNHRKKCLHLCLCTIRLIPRALCSRLEICCLHHNFCVALLIDIFNKMESIDGVDPVPLHKLAPRFHLWKNAHLNVTVVVVMGRNCHVHVQGVFQTEAFLLELNTGMGPDALVQYRPYELLGYIKNTAIHSNDKSLKTMALVSRDLRERLKQIVSNSKQSIFTQFINAVAEVALKHDRVYGLFPATPKIQNHPVLSTATKLTLVTLEDTSMKIDAEKGSLSPHKRQKYQ